MLPNSVEEEVNSADLNIEYMYSFTREAFISNCIMLKMKAIMVDPVETAHYYLHSSQIQLWLCLTL